MPARMGATIGGMMVIAGGLLWAADAGAQSYFSLCHETELSETPECAKLKDSHDEVRKMTRKFGGGRKQQPDRLCTEAFGRAQSSEENQDSAKCAAWREAVAKRDQAVAAVQVLKSGGVAAPGDSVLPVIEVSAPASVETKDGMFRITGLVGDDGSPPRLLVDGQSRALFEPGPGDPSLGVHTRAFDVVLPAGAAGERQVMLEVCDAAGNCAGKRLTVTVVASAQEPASEPTGAELEALMAKLQEGNLLSGTQDSELPVIMADALESVEVGDGGAVLVGLVGDDGSPPRLKVNGVPVTLFRTRAGEAPIAQHTMSFRVPIPTEAAGRHAFVLEACDAAGNCVGQELAVLVIEPNRPSIAGDNYALIIGNDEYEYLPDLKTAVNDAEAVARVLQSRYAFEPETVTLLINADRRTILGELSRLRGALGADDRLLVYYAGHGQIDPLTDEGFWQPVDARLGEDFSWIDNSDLKRYLRGMAAQHVLVVADSCFSGSLTRSAPDFTGIAEDRFFTEIDSHVSRKVITSGGTEPVADSGGGGHSIFARYFLKALEENDRPYLTSFELFNSFVRAVTNNSSQKPEYGTIAEAGDEGAGDFTFILRR